MWEGDRESTPESALTYPRFLSFGVHLRANQRDTDLYAPWLRTRSQLLSPFLLAPFSILYRHPFLHSLSTHFSPIFIVTLSSILYRHPFLQSLSSPFPPFFIVTLFPNLYRHPFLHPLSSPFSPFIIVTLFSILYRHPFSILYRHPVLLSLSQRRVLSLTIFDTHSCPVTFWRNATYSSKWTNENQKHYDANTCG